MNLVARIFLAWTALLFSAPLLAADAWTMAMEKKARLTEMPLITNRYASKAGQLQIQAAIGFGDRKDFNSHVPFSLSFRRFFSEHHGWEIVRLHRDFHSLSSVAEDVEKATGYVVDAQQADWSISTGYVYAPVYGKYALTDTKMIHFDGYIGASVGARLGDSRQFTFEPFFGVTHYFTPSFALILPEVRMKMYSEERLAGAQIIGELSVQAGLSWTL